MCPPARAETERLIVGFHRYPGGFAVGGTYLCEPVVNTDADLGFVVVEASNPRDFTQRAKADRDVRYVEPSPEERDVTTSG